MRRVFLLHRFRVGARRAAPARSPSRCSQAAAGPFAARWPGRVSAPPSRSPNGRLTCSGIYPLVGDAKIVTVTLRCNDGRTGIALVTHQDAFDGGGTVRFSDGTEGTFVFGDGATTI